MGRPCFPQEELHSASAPFSGYPVLFPLRIFLLSAAPYVEDSSLVLPYRPLLLLVFCPVFTEVPSSSQVFYPLATDFPACKFCPIRICNKTQFSRRKSSVFPYCHFLRSFFSIATSNISSSFSCSSGLPNLQFFPFPFSATTFIMCFFRS